MSDVFSRIWQVMETDPGHRGLTTDLPRADLKKLGFSLLEAGEIFIISGFPVQRAGGKGETDGPIGTANLAAVLEQIGKKVTVITDEPSCAAMLAACSIYAPSAEVLCVPKQGAQAFCYSLLKHHKPTHVIAIERPGRGADGHFHNFRGEYIDDLLADTDLLLYDKSTITIGIGDGGNELGMGNFRNMIEERVNHGDVICADAPADFTLTSGVSNWWGWGIRAVLSAVTGRDLMPTDEQENKLLRAVVYNGCVDGVTGEAVLTVDHLSQEENLRVLRELRAALQLPDYTHMEPAQARRLFRDNSMVRPTAGMCAGYAQCNLIVLPSKEAADFREFAKRNPFSCPVLEESEKGSRYLKTIARDIDLARDFPRYRVWKDGCLVEEPQDIEALWNDDLVAFLIGCSFSFEEALQQAGVPCATSKRAATCPCTAPTSAARPTASFPARWWSACDP